MPLEPDRPERPGHDAPAPAFIAPHWPAPTHVRAVSTTRRGGVSATPYDTLNVGAHCGDEPGAVARNRERLTGILGLTAQPRWLRQVHGTTVVDAAGPADEPEADAVVAARAGAPCVVLTADCLPILLCDRAGTCVGAAHAGWRGMAAGVIEACVARLPAPPGELIAWLGPAIGPRAYEVGPEVREALASGLGDSGRAAFAPARGGRWLANLYAIARLRLARAGVASVHGGDRCTHGEPETFFSYRRDGATGRMASMVWIAGRSSLGATRGHGA